MQYLLRLLLLTLAAFLGSLFASPDAQAFSWKTAPDDFFLRPSKTPGRTARQPANNAG
jgi:hypothetical protein